MASCLSEKDNPRVVWRRPMRRLPYPSIIPLAWPFESDTLCLLAETFTLPVGGLGLRSEYAPLDSTI